MNVRCKDLSEWNNSIWPIISDNVMGSRDEKY